MAKILIIDDDELFCDALIAALGLRGDDIIQCAHTLEDGLGLAKSGNFDIVLLDVYLPDGNGLDKLPEVRATASSPEVLIITGSATSECAALAITNGAWDYIKKPSPLNEIRLILKRALQYRNEKNNKKAVNELSFRNIIGNSPRMNDSLDLVVEAAATDVNVIITGETGTGKELFARAIHMNGARSEKSFVVVDCAALHDTLSESALFGYTKGAFTGAVINHTGLIKQSDGGTLFLDEIGELPLSLQKVFLRVLQEHHFRPLGSTREIESNFRLIAATNRNLDDMVQKGQFREDLYYRLRSLAINLPPLREHREDIMAIAGYHLKRICKRNNCRWKTLSPDFMNALLAYDWPGNVRELVNALERSVAAATTAAELIQRHLPSNIRVKLAQKSVEDGQHNGRDTETAPDAYPSLKSFREDIYAKAEKKYLMTLVQKNPGSVRQICKLSGLSRPRLYELLKKHGLSTKA